MDWGFERETLRGGGRVRKPGGEARGRAGKGLPNRVGEPGEERRYIQELKK